MSPYSSSPRWDNCCAARNGDAVFGWVLNLCGAARNVEKEADVEIEIPAVNGKLATMRLEIKLKERIIGGERKKKLVTYSFLTSHNHFLYILSSYDETQDETCYFGIFLLLSMRML